MKPSNYHACATGDCPHATQAECTAALLTLADEQAAEIDRLTAELAAAHRLDDDLRRWFNTRTCPIQLAIAIDEYRQVRYAATTAEREEP